MQEVLSKAESRMEKRMNHLAGDLAAIRAGRANPAVLDKIMVDYYGTPTPINQLAAVSVTEARTLMIQPWDASVVHPIEKAIQMSELGINPQTDVSIRNIRREAVEKFKAMKKSSEITEDDLKQAEKKIQELTDRFIKEIDKMAQAKQKEVMEI